MTARTHGGDEPPVRLVQRPTSELPVVHLERVPPAAVDAVEVGGSVAQRIRLPLERLRRLPLEERVWDLHCVWGWTRPGCRWGGVRAAALIDAARPLEGARFAMVRSVGATYESCLTIEEARASLLAWQLDGAPLSPEHGGPIRFVPPPSKWGYKGVKWVAEIVLLERFVPGFWEEMVGNPRGDVPDEMMDLRFE